jgi:hypothetical protein
MENDEGSIYYGPASHDETLLRIGNQGRTSRSIFPQIKSNESILKNGMRSELELSKNLTNPTVTHRSHLENELLMMKTVDPSKFQAAIQLLKESEEKLRKENPVKIA